MPSYVIAGASLAGAKAAETLRDEGFDGDIVLIGAEAERPYERPPLSKGYLLGNDARDSVYVHAADWYAEHGVDLREGVTVTAIDRGARTVATSSGAQVSYDKLLLATGASPRRLDFPGSDREEVLYLRTIADSDRLRSAFQPGTRVVVAGAGWIGLETAAAARTAECSVTVLEPQPGALHDQLGPEVGAVFAELHRAHGVEFRFGERAVEFRPGMVITSGGAEVHADILVVGIGAAPNDDLAAQTGLETGNGVLTDEALRTSDPDIFAAGDVANSFNPLLGRRVRVEHWANALNGGPVHAGPACPLRPGAVLLQRSVRPRHGVRGPALPGQLRPDSLPRRRRHPGVHRLLALRRRRDRRHERQRVGRQRRHPGPHPRRPPSRPRPPHQPRHPPNRPLTRSTPCRPPCVLCGFRCF
jgi:NADPH-dependent 2,4-dienoyl-CoA reductase/sulfur reductase-like enzyme